MTLDAMVLWRNFTRHILVILLAALVGSVLSFAIASRITPRFESKSIWFSQANVGSEASSLMSLVGLNSGGKFNSEMYYEALFKTSYLLENLVDRKWPTTVDSIPFMTTFQVFKVDTNAIVTKNKHVSRSSIGREYVLAALKSAAFFTSESNVYTLTMRTSDAFVSRAMNQAILDNLESFNKKSEFQNNSRESDFLKERLNTFEKKLSIAEQRLLSFQLQNQGELNQNLQLMEARLEREVNIQSTLVLEFRKQLELSLVQKQKEPSPLLIIQPPSMPINKSWPKRSFFVVIGFAFGLTLAYGFFLVRDFQKMMLK